MRLIDADELVKRLKEKRKETQKWAKRAKEDRFEANGAVMAFTECIGAVHDTPTKTSNKPDTYFILSMPDYHGLSWWECAECGYNEIGNNKNETKLDYNYCPQCGRKITEFRKRGNLK